MHGVRATSRFPTVWEAAALIPKVGLVAATVATIGNQVTSYLALKRTSKLATRVDRSQAPAACS